MFAIDSRHCTGCRACEQVCPKQCIHMHADENGFLFPEVEKENCSGCGLCERACPIAQDIRHDRSPLVYAAHLKDPQALKRSSSGGVFPALARLAFKRQGAVYGCAWDSDWKVVTVRITREDELRRIQGSKYMQGDTGGSYRAVRRDLRGGQYVLYTGTPCQVAGLKAFLGGDWERLLTADIVCHGVPSPSLFADYISWLSRKVGGKIVDYNFRDKMSGWGHIGTYGYIKKGTVNFKKTSSHLDPYYYFFQKGFFDRECCYTCPYAGPMRPGDFTMGDFWGIERFHPDFPAGQGASVLLVNSPKARSLMREMQEALILTESTLEKASQFNGQLVNPTHRNPMRDQLMKTERESRFEGVYRAYCQTVGPKRFLYPAVQTRLGRKLTPQILRVRDKVRERRK